MVRVRMRASPGIRLEQLKAVFFDFGDTLVSLNPSKEKLFIKAANRVGLKLSMEAVKVAYRVVDFHNKYSSLTIVNSLSRRIFYKNYNRQLCEVLGISTYFAHLYPIIYSFFKSEKKWKLVKGVRSVLTNLQKDNIPLAIVANWDRKLPALVEKLGISSFFYSIITSQEVGVEKPNLTIFTQALAGLPFNSQPNQILYVGNEYETDVLGARMAGLVPVLIDKDRLYLYADSMRFDSLTRWYNFLKS